MDTQSNNVMRIQQEAHTMKKVINTVMNTVTFTFEGLDSVTLKMADVNPSNQAYAALHGMAARIGDNAAIPKTEANGYIVTEAMRRAAVVEMVDHYTGGSAEWNLRVSERKAPQNATIAAIAAKMGVTYTEAEVEVQRRMLAELEGM
jgi:hypothetical protein